MSIYRFEGMEPRVHPSAFIAPGASLIGQVDVAEQASVWFGAIVRADTERVVIGRGSNVQDAAVLHADPGEPCVLGPGVTVGHRAVVHGAKVEEGALIGIGAIVLNRARIGKGAIVGAGAVVSPGMEVPPGMLVVGVPARVIRPVEPTDNAQHYIELSRRYLEGLSAVIPVSQYSLTLRGQDALNGFSDLHHHLKRSNPVALGVLKTFEKGSPSEPPNPDIMQTLVQEGLIRVG
jgi:carbonic anhydrase/acetyltransferase-like protein (isoleucine patch superfamily)